MKRILNYSGIAAIVTGIITFAVDYSFKINSNAMLLIGLALVLAGVAGQIWVMKKTGNGE